MPLVSLITWYAYVTRTVRVDFTSARTAAWEADVSWISTLPPRRTRPARPYKHISHHPTFTRNVFSSCVGISCLDMLPGETGFRKPVSRNKTLCTLRFMKL